jgi:hypothetical protein
MAVGMIPGLEPYGGFCDPLPGDKDRDIGAGFRTMRYIMIL